MNNAGRKYSHNNWKAVVLELSQLLTENLISIVNTFTVKGATEPVDIEVDSLPD